MRAVLLCGLLLLTACQSAPDPPSPEQQALFDQAVDVELVVVAARNALRYETTEIRAPAGSTVRLVMDNASTTSPAMVHNVVVVRDEAAVERVGRAAAGVREAPVDEAVLIYTPLAGPGERTAVVFEMPSPGTYPFLCTYPGHFQFMQGTLISTVPAEPQRSAGRRLSRRGLGSV